MWEPPSVILKREFARLAKTSNPADLDVDNEAIENRARQNLLIRREVKMWSEHLAEVCERRTTGFRKAATTRKAKRARSRFKLACTSFLAAGIDY